MIDSHCHLDHDPLYNNLSEVIKRSKAIGVQKILTICTTKNSFNNILKMVDFDPIIYGTFGIHPHESENESVSNKEIKDNISKHLKIIGVGETGLDFFYNHSSREKQISSFKTHIEAAIELDLPIIVHSRNAENETFNILNSYFSLRPKILMHCFTGSKEFAHKLIKLNAFFSASGIITFNSSFDLQKTFKEIPVGRLLIETDSPFLAPVPMRGKKNEPSFIKFTLEKLAEIKSMEINIIKNLTTNNFKSLFSVN